MTATHAGDKLKKALAQIARDLGAYPHAALNPNMRPTKKQSTRLLKMVCMKDGYTIRTTRKWIDELGAPTCACGREFVEEESEGGEE